MIIAIDGPSGSGKSSIAQALAHKLNLYCMSTGAMYRGLAYVVIHVLDYQAEEFHYLTGQDIQQLLQPHGLYFHFIKNSCAQVYFKQTDLSPYLKLPEISQAASLIATYKPVRDALTNFFRHASTDKNMVVEGRDIGTVVLPHASFKFFLTASLSVRAQRIYDLLHKQQCNIPYEQVLEELKQRDQRDMSRATAPLKPATDAIIIDNSHLDLEQTIQLFLRYIP